MKLRIIFLLLIIELISFRGFTQKISDYIPYYGYFNLDSNQLIILRKYTKDRHEYVFCVNPINLETSIYKVDDIEICEFSFDSLKVKFSFFPYFKAIEFSKLNSKSLQDAGITHSYPIEKGINLTVDLCPSTKQLNKIIFEDLINEFNKVEHPLPIALCVSGTWINEHVENLIWLKELETKGFINITWVNHSFTHPTNNKLPITENFLLEKEINLSTEIFNNEIKMIENGLIPSVFFRFPGLVSDESIFLKVLSYGIIPIGSDAWLAKNEEPKNGSFVLIHGNGNEPKGVEKFIELLQIENVSIKNRNWQLYDLKGSVILDTQSPK